MHLDYLRLYNFRNYSSLELYPHQKISVIYGQNGSGKTNILEAVHFSCFARSHRTRQDRDIIRIGENSSAVEIKSTRLDGNHNLSIHMELQPMLHKTAFSYGQKLPKISDIFGNCSCVIFAPEDMNIIKGSPQDRRRFMDMQICQMNTRYLNELSQYQAAVRQRNALLKLPQYSNVNSQFDTWEHIMDTYGSYIINRREEFIAQLCTIAQSIYNNISASSSEKLDLVYVNNIRSFKNQTLSEILKQNRENDIKRGSTSYGPHKDDIRFTLSKSIMDSFSSQGQIRTAVLALKLAMIQLIEHNMGEKPILLLDDVFSELDTKRRSALLEYIGNTQCFITCTDLSDIQNTKADSYISVIKENNSVRVVQE